MQHTMRAYYKYITRKCDQNDRHRGARNVYTQTLRVNRGVVS